MNIGQPERATQNRDITLFRDELGYASAATVHRATKPLLHDAPERTDRRGLDGNNKAVCKLRCNVVLNKIDASCPELRPQDRRPLDKRCHARSALIAYNP